MQPVHEKPDDYRRQDNEEQCSYQHPEHHGEHSEAAHHICTPFFLLGTTYIRLLWIAMGDQSLFLAIVPFRIRKTHYILVPLLLAMVSSYSTTINSTFDTCIRFHFLCSCNNGHLCL